MVRFIAMLVGIAFAGVLAIALFSSVSGVITDPPAPTAEHEFHRHPKDLDLASNGPLGKFDMRQVQRGLQVYKEVCSACHSLRLVSFRDIKDMGYSDGQVKAFAASYDNIPSINPDTGEVATRKGVPSDRFPSPFANDVAARAANNNALPPDLSLMTKARHDGPAYIYSLLTGFQNQPAELLKKFPDAKTPAGLHYNPYFANLNIAMAPPLTADGQVTYSDGTKSTVDQMAKDVAAFLTWTAEPKMQTRHSAGLAAMLFLLIFCVLAYGAYQNVWRNVKH
ncbi:cytochrome C [Sphingomonas sp. Leaf357]|uniref:cytochrome c1 n=1 Tax=Sphingomonas sp. Leaf357 TaxID=1736350 RepID=UPI0006FCA617|nr:cytochrome c1 [Sphingomonas sp. Leaf357]KQS02059.1 cytochrome C [Sphingomonas sp. Leaf357]